MKQIYMFRPRFLCLMLTLFSFFQIQAFYNSNFFNDGGTVTASQTVFLNETPDPLVESAAPTIAGPYEYLWMISIPSDPLLNGWNPIIPDPSTIPSATNSSLTFVAPLDVTTLFTRCVRLAGSNDNYVETNVIVITVLNALPIELISFEAHDNGNGSVKLSWATASERNNEYFQIESSNDGINFNIIERIEGTLNSDELKTYSYLDNDPHFGENYYRLKQVDTNGDFEYSDIISIKITQGFANSISVFPNPVVKELNIKMNKPLSNNSNLEIFNTMGQMVFRSNSISNSIVSIDLESLSYGTYFIKIMENSTILFQDKIIKLK